MFTSLPMCDPCKTENLSKQSDGFCTDCKENMCQTCFLHHLKAKSCRNHVLDPFHPGSSDSGLQIQEEKCKKHIKETIKYYCLSHDSVICGDCLVLDHPKCEPKFIKDVANNFEESSKFKDFVIKMPKWEADKEEGTMHVERNRKDNKALLDNALQKLRKSREEINVWLDKMEKDIEIEARKISDDNELLLSEIEKNLEAVSDDINTIKEKMDTKLYHRETLFINMVECKPKIDAIEATFSDIKTKNEIRTYAFEPEINVNETSFLRVGVIKVSSDVNKDGAQSDSKGDFNLFAGIVY